MPYRAALALQKARHRRVSAGLLPDTLLLLEHEPVITLGRASGRDHVLTADSALSARGIEVVPTGRGGDVTYHGPGQLVAYPILKLSGDDRDVGRFVFRLEEMVLRTLARFQIEATREPGLRGLWVGNDKIAAIGIRMVEWVSCHGLALNVSILPTDFADIVPCGLHGRGVTNMASLLGKHTPSIAEVAEVLAEEAGHVLARPLDVPDNLSLPDVDDASLGRDFFL